MASITTNAAPVTSGRLRDTLARVATGFSAGFAAYLDRASRSDQVRALQAKSDEELARLNLKREDIPRHVFRDLLWA